MRTSVPLAASQIRTLPFCSPAAMRVPSGDQATLKTSPIAPCSSRTMSPVARSHTSTFA